MSKYFDGELLSEYEDSPKTTTSNTSDFVDLLNREMEELIKLYKCKKEPTTAVGCQKLIEPFICQIEKFKFVNYQKDKKITDLEAKLAGYEEIMKKHNIVGTTKLDACLSDYLNIDGDTMSGKMIKQLKQKLTQARENLIQCDADRKFEQEKKDIAKRRVSELKQQLAEKDELIGTLKNKYECADRELYLTKDTLKHHTNIYNSLVESRTQDKISFALEQLEKVKEILNKSDESGYIIQFRSMNDRLMFYKEFDNQIKQLKEGK